MDAKGRDAFWEKVANAYNSDITFDITKSDKGPDRFKGLSAAPTGYVAEAAKLKYEFGQLRAALTKALVNFRKSGMGDGAPQQDDDTAEGQEEVYSAEFRDFCQGDELLEYLEFMLTKHDLLDSATCDMPNEAKFNSDSKRRITGAKPKQKKRKKGTGIDAKELKLIVSSLPPLKLHKTKSAKAAEKAHSFRQLLKTYEGLDKMLLKLGKQISEARHELTRALMEQSTDVDSAVTG